MATISIAEAVDLIHQAQELMPKVPPHQRDELKARIDALVSVVVLFIRVPQPEVTYQQWKVLAGLRAYLSDLKEAA